MSNQQNKGEGNAEADRNYREATEEFVKSGKVEEQKQDRRNVSEDEKEKLEEAEEAGKKPARS